MPTGPRIHWVLQKSLAEVLEALDGRCPLRLLVMFLSSFRHLRPRKFHDCIRHDREPSFYSTVMLMTVILMTREDPGDDFPLAQKPVPVDKLVKWRHHMPQSKDTISALFRNMCAFGTSLRRWWVQSMTGLRKSHLVRLPHHHACVPQTTVVWHSRSSCLSMVLLGLEFGECCNVDKHTGDRGMRFYDAWTLGGWSQLIHDLLLSLCDGTHICLAFFWRFDAATCHLLNIISACFMKKPQAWAVLWNSLSSLMPRACLDLKDW